MKFGVSRNLKAFTDEAVGTKVLEGQTFLDVLETKVEQHNPAKDRAPGQHFIMCPEAVPLVSCGIGERTTNPNDYVARLYRGRVELFLKREKAAEVTGCAVVVYTRAAYLNDPDVKKEPEELARIEADQEMTHIIIAVLAFGGPPGPPSADAHPVHREPGREQQRSFVLDKGRNPRQGCRDPGVRQPLVCRRGLILRP